MRTPIRRCLLAAPPVAVALLLVTAAPAGALFGCGIDPLCIIGKASHTYNAIHPLVHVPKELTMATEVTAHFVATYG